MTRRYYVEIAGRRQWRASLASAQGLAQRLADDLRKAVTVGYEDDPPAAKTFGRNPVMRGHNYTGEEWKVVGWKGNQPMTAYANSKAEVRDITTLMNAKGFRFVLARQTSKAYRGR